MHNKEIAEIFEKIGTLLEIKGELIFKIRAYYKAAENIASLAEDIDTLYEEKRLHEIPGVGKTLQEKIGEFIQTGKLKAYEELTKEIPESVLEMVAIPTVGPKKAKLFYDELGVKSLADLKKALEKNRLDGLPGIKEKTIENIKKGVTLVESGQARMHLGKATEIAQLFLEILREEPAVKHFSVAGSLRRGRETIRDIDILVDTTDPKKVIDTFIKNPFVKSINAQGDTKVSILTKENVQVDLRIVEEKSFGAALLYFTGSKNFNIKIRQVAMKKDLKVNEYGIFSVKGKEEKWIAGKTEQDCFKALGLPFVPPELREDLGEQRIFEDKKIPQLIEISDIKGDLHMHSVYSDGKNTIEEMAQAAIVKGYSYIAVSDHSEKLKIASGLTEADLIRKRKEIDLLNSKLKNFRILLGSEVEIDTNGELDYNDKILKSLDIVIASIHSRFEQSSEQLTKRLVKAIQSKRVHVIGHPTGVHFGKRDSYPIDLKEVCKAARDYNVCLEINACPIRLDLNSTNAYFARECGAKFSINTDAHAVGQLDFMRHGISVARRGWLTKNDVINCLSLSELSKFLQR